jgi:hypothetical protein
VALSDNAMCRKCGVEESYTALAGHRMRILASAWLGLIDIRRASIK